MTDEPFVLNSSKLSWVDEWNLRDKEDVHPSHRICVVEANDVVCAVEELIKLVWAEPYLTTPQKQETEAKIRSVFAFRKEGG